MDRDEALLAAGAAALQVFEAARAARPNVVLEYDAFERYFGRHGTSGNLERAIDMYIACACASRVDAALVELEGVLATDVARAVASVEASPRFVEEVLQVTRERLLVPARGEPAKIATYAGRASLKSWLCAVAIRVAFDLRRQQAHPIPKAWAGATGDGRGDRGGPELEYLRRRYKGSFENAVRVAIEELAPRQRMLLRLNVIEGLSIDKLAVMYNVGRSTAARWVADARSALVDATRRELQSHLGVSSNELDSLSKDIQSQLDVSIVKLLGR